MTEPRRMPPETVRRRVHEGDALLVCAYDDREKCESVALEDSIPFPDFQE